MIKAKFLQSIKFFISLRPEKQVLVILVVIIMFIVPWLKVLLSNESKDNKEALKKCENASLEKDRISYYEISRLRFMYDSLLNKAINDKEETNSELRKLLNNAELINNKIKAK